MEATGRFDVALVVRILSAKEGEVMGTKNVRAALNALGMHNDYEFFAGQPYVWQARRTARECYPHCWYVTQRGVRLDPKAHWMDGGSKGFSYSGNGKDAFAQAKAWAENRFGIKEWKRSPFGSYGDAEFIKKRISELLGRGANVLS